MAPGMSVARRPLPVSPVSFKPQPKNESARSSTPYRIYSKRKITNLPLKPTLHQAKPFGKPLIGYQPSLNPIVSFSKPITIFTPGRQAHQIICIRQRIRFVEIIDTPGQPTFRVAPGSKTADMEISYCQYFGGITQAGAYVRPKLSPPVKCPAEKE